MASSFSAERGESVVCLARLIVDPGLDPGKRAVLSELADWPDLLNQL